MHVSSRCRRRLDRHRRAADVAYNDRMGRIGWMVAIMIACGKNTKTAAPHDGAISDVRIDAPIDAGCPDAAGDAGNGVCNPLTQTGCPCGDKCTWIIDQVSPTFAGHIGCAPNGTMAARQACTRNAPGATGWDDCIAGAYCLGPLAGGPGTCKLICDPAGGAPSCGPSGGCVLYDDVFQQGSQPTVAGVCEYPCDPLADNNISGSGKTGTTCGSRGCYGLPPDFNGSMALSFGCAPEANPTRVHRSACTGTIQTGDAAACLFQGSIYPNSCAQGYQPLINDREGSSQIDCIAMCGAADCYAGHCGSDGSAYLGIAPHQCVPADLRIDPSSTFQQTTGSGGVGPDGEQCTYIWNMEFDSTGHFLRSPTSDTLGLCVNRGLYVYDSNGDGQLTSTDAIWPRCDAITSVRSGPRAADGTCTVANGCVGADGMPANVSYGPFACVSATTAGMAFGGKASTHHFPMLRLPYRDDSLPRRGSTH